MGGEVERGVRRDVEKTVMDLTQRTSRNMARPDRALFDLRGRRTGRLSAESSAYAALFDLYDVDMTNDTVKVRGCDTVSDKVAVVAGVHITVTGSLDSDITISADTYIYLNIDRATPAAAIATTGTFGDGDDDEERFYLWYVPWDSGNSRIDAVNILDLRGMPRWVAGA